VSDEDRWSDDTAPLSSTPGPPPPEAPLDAPTPDVVEQPGTSWLPPRVQPPPGQWAGPATSPYPQAQPAYPPPGQHLAPTHGAQPPRGRVPGWLWPVVCALALVIGVVGGVFGGAVYDDLHNRDTVGQVSGGLADTGTRTQAPLPANNHSVASVAQSLLPSTIQVLAFYHGANDGATGSGFALDRSGHYITNNHVVTDAVDHHGPIEIMDQDGDKYTATVVGRSPTYDLAVLYVKHGPVLPPASLGSAAELRVGDQVVAFGSPLGLNSTVTAGIVSALNRPVTTGESATESSYINAVQTDAAINPGNSGGPLVNLAGQVVGVNSAIATTGSSAAGESGNIGVGFAIPIDQVKVTADQILRTGEARYPVIGAKVDTGTTGSSAAAGAKVTDVLTGTPAQRGGLEAGDVVTEVSGNKVPDGIALIVAIRSHRPGEVVDFTVRRAGELIHLRITLGSEVG
jgi:putative serine protease PepD